MMPRLNRFFSLAVVAVAVEHMRLVETVDPLATSSDRLDRLSLLERNLRLDPAGPSSFAETASIPNNTNVTMNGTHIVSVNATNIVARNATHILMANVTNITKHPDQGPNWAYWRSSTDQGPMVAAMKEAAARAQYAVIKAETAQKASINAAQKAEAAVEAKKEAVAARNKAMKALRDKNKAQDALNIAQTYYDGKAKIFHDEDTAATKVEEEAKVTQNTADEQAHRAAFAAQEAAYAAAAANASTKYEPVAEIPGLGRTENTSLLEYGGYEYEGDDRRYDEDRDRRYDEDRSPRRYDDEDRGPRRYDYEERGPMRYDDEERSPMRYDEDRGPRGYDDEERGPRRYDEEERGPWRYDDEDRGPRRYAHNEDDEERGPRDDEDVRGPGPSDEERRPRRASRGPAGAAIQTGAEQRQDKEALAAAERKRTEALAAAERKRKADEAREAARKSLGALCELTIFDGHKQDTGAAGRAQLCGKWAEKLRAGAVTCQSRWNDVCKDHSYVMKDFDSHDHELHWFNESPWEVDNPSIADKCAEQIKECSTAGGSSPGGGSAP